MRFPTLLTAVAAVVITTPALAAEVTCQFDQECPLGESCTPTDFQASFVEQQNRANAFAVIFNGSIKALGEAADFDGLKGTIIAMSSAAVAPYADAYVLSFSPSQAVLAITGLTPNDKPSVKLLLGTCEVKD